MNTDPTNTQQHYFFLVIIPFCFLLMVTRANITKLEDDHAKDITVVETVDGPIKGRVMLSVEGRIFIGFMGIPYAAPPVRFKPPQPVEPWSKVRNAREEGPICAQYLITTEVVAGEENCLTLSVFTHQHTNRVPVLVWVHGDLFHAGDGSVDITGPRVIMEHNLVYVSINYRLGALGFLSTGDKHLPGNYGLKDQVAALHWINRNIDRFGGDPKRVTIYGSSAGAACVHYHLFSTLSTGLFSRIVFQSGSVLNFWAFQRHPLKTTYHIAKLVNCPSENTVNMVECLRKISVEKLIETLYHFPHWALRIPIPFGPVVEFQSIDSDDPPFLTGNPEYLLMSGYVNDVPSITGVIVEEFAALANLILHDPAKLQEMEDDFVGVTRKILHLHSLKSSAILRIRDFYLGNSPVSNATYLQLTNMFSDGYFIHGVQRAARLQAASSHMPVYYYILNLGSQERANAIEGQYKESNAAGDFINRAKLFQGPKSIDEQPKSVTLMWTLLTDFCDKGNPTPESSSVSNLWTPLPRTGTFKYLEIDEETMIMKSSSPNFFERMEFWDSIYHEIDEELNDECEGEEEDDE